MATRQEQLRELRRLLINKEAEIKRAEARLNELYYTGWHGEFTKQGKKFRRLKRELETLQSRISTRETTLQKQQREAASG